MSDIKSQLNTDILRFFDNIEKQTHNDKIQTLKDLFDKYIHLSSCEYTMNQYDLKMIINNAKNNFATHTFPIFLGEKKYPVYQGDLSNLCIIEATVSHLNKNDCLKKIAKFDKREDKF